jgi:hypothetical protein
MKKSVVIGGMLLMAGSIFTGCSSNSIENRDLKVNQNTNALIGKSESWAGKAPYPYENKDTELVAISYKEPWAKSSVEKYPEAIQKAKKTLKEWGQNPEQYEYQGKRYDYEIYIFESPNFISITFYPMGLNVTSQEVEIRMTKDELKILSIFKGS